MPASCRARRRGSPRTAAARSGAIAVGQVMRSGRCGGSGRPTPRGGAAASRISPDVTGRGLAPRYRPRRRQSLYPCFPSGLSRAGAARRAMDFASRDPTYPFPSHASARGASAMARPRRAATPRIYHRARAAHTAQCVRPRRSRARPQVRVSESIHGHTHTEAERPARHAALAERKPAPGRSLASRRRACHLHDTRRNAAPAGRRRAARR